MKNQALFDFLSLKDIFDKYKMNMKQNFKYETSEKRMNVVGKNEEGKKGKI